MIKLFTRPTCSYCPTVKKYLTNKNKQFTEHLADGEEYEKLAQKYGVSVPLIYNEETQDGTTGFNISILNRVAQIQ